MKLECIGFVNFQPENIRQGIYGLVTIVLERAWAALKCDQLPVVKTGIRFSLRDKWLFEITEVEITRVDCIWISF